MRRLGIRVKFRATTTGDSRWRLFVVLACCWTCVPTPSSAQSPANVAVVINESDAASVRVGEYYVQKRSIPAANVIRLQTTTDEIIQRADFTTAIERPIATALTAAQLQDQVLYLVLAKGIPLRIVGTGGRDGTAASVDSELALLYRKMTDATVLTRGPADNPYFLADGNISTARPFSRRDHDIFLVSRLDGFTVEDALALVDRSLTAVDEGVVVLDQQASPRTQVGDEWLATAARQLAERGFGDRVRLETTDAGAREEGPVVGYFSWGSGDPSNRARQTGMRFVPGAIAASFVSDDARTFREPPEGWTPSASANRAEWHGGSPGSLIGDLVREGVTGVAGQVGEPYLQSVVRPDRLFAAYLAGHGLVDSFYLALPHLSWRAVVLGDPLCRPFPGQDDPARSSDVPLDPATDLPQYFSERRVQAAAARARGVELAAVKAWVRSGVMRGRGDMAAAKRALDEVVALDPAFIAGRLDRAILLDTLKEWDGAIADYEEIVKRQPNHVIALNNLAYALAVRKNSPEDGLRHARRAATLAPSSADVLDTWGWIEHLLGDDKSAVRRLEEAARRAPRNAQIRLHAAVVQAAVGQVARAQAHLAEALKLDPALGETEEVKQLQAQLGGQQP